VSQFINLMAIEEATGFTSRAAKQQIYQQARNTLAAATPEQRADKTGLFKLWITGPKGDYELTVKGAYSLKYIIDFFHKAEDDLAESHEHQIDRRLADIAAERQRIGYRGKQAAIAQEALNAPEAAALDKVGYPPRPYSAGAALSALRPRVLKSCAVCGVWFVGYPSAEGCCSPRCRKRKSRQDSQT